MAADYTNRVSLFTDASFSHTSKYGGWGAWARNVRYRVFNGGPIGTQDDPLSLKDATEAEYYAAFYGLQMLEGTPLLPPPSQRPFKIRVLLQTDNLRVAQMMPVWSPHDGKHPRVSIPKPRTSTEEHIQEAIAEFAHQHNVELVGRHVKGHQSSKKATRNYVNNLCDRLAGQGRFHAENPGSPPTQQPILKDFGVPNVSEKPSSIDLSWIQAREPRDFD